MTLHIITAYIVFQYTSIAYNVSNYVLPNAIQNINDNNTTERIQYSRNDLLRVI